MDAIVICARRQSWRRATIISSTWWGGSSRVSQCSKHSRTRALLRRTCTRKLRVTSAWAPLVVPVQEQIAGDSRTGLLVLLGAVAFVLLVACVNVANLLLARASARQKELAIRASLGASRARIVRQVIIECLPLGIIGGLLGLLLAIWGIDLLSSLLPATLPRGNPISVNGSRSAFYVCAGSADDSDLWFAAGACRRPKPTCVNRSTKADAAESAAANKVAYVGCW